MTQKTINAVCRKCKDPLHRLLDSEEFLGLDSSQKAILILQTTHSVRKYSWYHLKYQRPSSIFNRRYATLLSETVKQRN